MKFLCSVDIYFEIEANDSEDKYEKAWDFIRDNLPDKFITEGSEVYLEEEDE